MKIIQIILIIHAFIFTQMAMAEVTIGVGIKTLENKTIITMIAPNSPADKAGLKTNDLIKSYNHRTISSSSQLIKLINLSEPNLHKSIVIQRNEKILSLFIAPKERNTDLDIIAFAEKGDEYFQFEAGLMYHNGKKVERDYNKAFYWFNKSAKQGNITAQYNMGHMYYYGQSVNKNNKKASYWLELSANSGFEKAQYLLKRITLEEEKIEDTKLAKMNKTTSSNPPVNTNFNFLEPNDGLKSLREYISRIGTWQNEPEPTDNSETWKTVGKVLLGIAAVAATVATAKALNDNSSSNTTCLRPDGDCSSAQSRRGYNLLTKAKNKAAYKIKNMCKQAITVKEFLKNNLTDVLFAVGEDLMVSLTGDPENFLVDVNKFRNAMNCS